MLGTELIFAEADGEYLAVHWHGHVITHISKDDPNAEKKPFEHVSTTEHRIRFREVELKQKQPQSEPANSTLTSLKETEKNRKSDSTRSSEKKHRSEETGRTRSKGKERAVANAEGLDE